MINPDAAAHHLVEVFVGAASTRSTTSTTSTASTAAAKRGVSARRIAGLSALGVGAAVGLILLLSRPASPTATVEPLAVDRAPAAETAALSPSASAPAIAPRPIAGPPSAPSADRTTAAGPGALRDEIALIDGARAALAAGAPTQALSLLERYRARHPHGMLLPEALAMRIEAIDRSGEHARAQSLARAFLAEYPKSPLAQRVAHIGARE